MKTNDLDLLNGPILKKLIIYIFPLMCTNLLQVLYNAADMIIVGLSNVDGAIGSIGTTAAMINLIINLFVGLSTGSSIMVARHIGENNPELIEKSVHTSIIVGIVSGLLAGILGFCVCKPFLKLLGDEGHILVLATTYAKIYFAGVPFIAITNFLIAIFRAKGDTKTCLTVLTISGIINVILNLFFVLVLKMNVDGVAYATVISNIISLCFLTVILTTDKGPCRLRLNKIRCDKEELKQIIRNGLPVGLQGVIFSFSNTLIQSSIISVNTMLCPGGSSVIDGNAAASSIEGFVYTATNSIATSETTFVSQHYGAKKYKRMDEVIKKSYLLTFIVSSVFSCVILLLKKKLLEIYLSDSLSIEIGTIRLIWMVAPYFLLAFMEMGSSTLKGMNKPLISTTVSLIGSCLVRILWITFVFSRFKTLASVYVSYPISWGLTAIVHLIFIFKTRKQMH